MFEINVDNAERYLRDAGRIDSNESVKVSELAGGVSNVVLLVSRREHTDFVLKQARDQLRVPDPWFCGVERICREVETLRLCHHALAATSDKAIDVPEILFEDRDNYAFAMSAVPRHDVWKSQLLAGETDRGVANACGRMMVAIHSQTWNDSATIQQLADTTFFDDLRVDPYYRHVARANPRLDQPISRLIDSLQHHGRCLVHGDFSPKNLLVHAAGVTLVDCEVGHFGDPAFDIGFFASHLVLKAIRVGANFAPYLDLLAAFWQTYAQSMRATVDPSEWHSLARRAASNLAGCAIARVDGKSQVDYLSPSQRDQVRACFLPKLIAQDAEFGECLDEIAHELKQACEIT